MTPVNPTQKSWKGAPKRRVDLLSAADRAVTENGRMPMPERATFLEPFDGFSGTPQN